MSEILIPGGASGAGSDDCTATAADVIKGKTAIVSGSNDEPTVGTLTLSGNATAAYVYTGKTFYSTDPKIKLTGTMTVNSILSFSAQAYSGRQILLKWQNPYAATGRPFTGVNINYSTDSSSITNWIYTGVGNNTASGGWSQAIVTLPLLNTLYYFQACAYVECSVGKIWSPPIRASATTSGVLTKIFTASASYTIPSGYKKMDLFAVGGGAKGDSGIYSEAKGAGGGGGSGYTKTITGIPISSGQIITYTIGAGGIKVATTSGTKSGGDSFVSSNGIELIRASGGGPRKNNLVRSGGNGGSGGGAGGYSRFGHQYTNGCTGGSDGANGSGYTGEYGSGDGGIGQGTTTRAFGSSTGTIYAGGGGGGGFSETSAGASNGPGGAGGSGGGGRGGHGGSRVIGAAENGVAGAANTGGGGGAGGAGSEAGTNQRAGSGGNGGSGVILVKLY